MGMKNRAILIMVFILAVAAIILQFAADLQFNSAKKLESVYLWQEAKGKYRLAVKLNPFNAQYFAGYGDFLRDKSLYQEDRIAWLKMAENLYERALELNPRCAEYALSSGQVKLELFLSDKDKFKDRLGLGLDVLKRALENDPNGFNTSYSAGYAGMKVWDNLNAVEQEWVLDRFRKIRPVESAQEKKEKLKRIERIKQGNLSQSWQGKSKGGDVYENGNMYWEGTVDTVLNVPKGKAMLKIQAKGSPADGIWPYMLVELDGEEIGETFVNSPEWKEYEFRVDTSGTVPLGGQKSALTGTVPSDTLRVLSVTFTNDGGNKEEDRNLYVGEVRITDN